MKESSKNKLLKGGVWSAVDRIGLMGLQFGANLVLARLLVPAAFGAIAILSVFIAVAQVMIDGGFCAALIQKKNPTRVDYSTSFYCSFAISLILYGVLWLSAPGIASFFRMAELGPVLRVWGLVLMLLCPVALMSAMLRKQLRFKALAICNVSSYAIGASVGIVAAANGAGVWALIAMLLTNPLMQSVSLSVATKGLPVGRFSLDAAKKLFSFGGFMLAGNIVHEICINLQNFIIGRKFTPTITGYYSQAQKLQTTVSYVLPQVVVQVMFPVFSSLQDDTEALGKALRKNVRIIAGLIYPLLGFLIVTAEELLPLLYGDQWIPAVPYFRVLCCMGFFTAVVPLNFYAVAAVGQSRKLFLWNLYKYTSLAAILFIGMNFGIYGILWGLVVAEINYFVVQAYLSSRYAGLPFMRQVLTMLPIGAAVGASVVVAAIFQRYLHDSAWLAGAVFVMTYLAIAGATRMKGLTDLVTMARTLAHLPFGK